LKFSLHVSVLVAKVENESRHWPGNYRVATTDGAMR